MTWKRARQPEQQAIRRKTILDAARSLFVELDYEEISLNAIAREAGITKPGIYGYFSGREEIFLTIYDQERERFVRSMIRRVQRANSDDPVEVVASAWTNAALKHRVWLDLSPQLPLSMEKNSSVDSLVPFKISGYDAFSRLVAVLAERFHQLDAGQWSMVGRCGYALMAGLWPIANPGPNVRLAYEHPDVMEPPWEFESLFYSGIKSLIRSALLDSN